MSMTGGIVGILVGILVGVFITIPLSGKIHIGWAFLISIGVGMLIVSGIYCLIEKIEERRSIR